jgi:hypothetical protein
VAELSPGAVEVLDDCVAGVSPRTHIQDWESFADPFLMRLALTALVLLSSFVTTETRSGSAAGGEKRSPADYLNAAFSSSDGASSPDGEVQAEPRLRDAITILMKTQAGRSLIERGLKAWHLEQPQDLVRVLRWGPASRTDAVLTRHLDPRSGREYREREVTIYLKKGQAMEDLVLDLAHELVHATTRPDWDPYDPSLTPGKYIHATIEGSGGEVDAVVYECQVGIELALKYGTSAKRCRSYLSSDSKDATSARIDRKRVRRDFYRVGDWSGSLGQRLGKEKVLFPLLSSQAPKLYSSTGKAPYPVALLVEFEEITRVACENTARRVRAAQGRVPASSGSEFLAARCGGESATQAVNGKDAIRAPAAATEPEVN